MSFSRLTRMISFRVSEREFEQLRNKSEAHGARSISDYARVALCGSIKTPDAHSDTHVQKLNEGIQQLSVDIRHLAQLLEAPRSARADQISPSEDGREKKEPATDPTLSM